MADPTKNFAKVDVSIGYASGATTIVLATGDGAKLPAPATDGAFNLVWWNSTDYTSPTADPSVEIVRVTARSTDTLTVTRAQEGTSDVDHNTGGKSYSMLLSFTKKTYDDIFNSPVFVTPTLGAASATSLSITGTAGNGWVDFIAQASNPSAPAAGTTRLHSATTQGFTRLEQDNEATTNIILGRDSVTIAKNTSGGTINKGEVVYITGSTGNVPNIAKAQANSSSTMPAVFVVVDDISNNAFGQVMRSGIISNFDTSAFSTGAPIWLSPTVAGGLTATRPSGTTNIVQRIGTVLVSGVGNGSIDVQIAPAPLNMETGTNAATWTASAIVGTGLQLSGLTASEIVITDGSKNLVSAAVATYPSLTELSYVKGVTSAIQTQLGTKANLAGATFTGAIANTVDNADNYVSLTLTNNDTTNNPNTFNLVNATTGRGFFLDQNGNGGGAYIDSEATSVQSLLVEGQQTSNQVVRILGQAALAGGGETATCIIRSENASQSAPTQIFSNEGTGTTVSIKANNTGASSGTGLQLDYLGTNTAASVAAFTAGASATPGQIVYTEIANTSAVTIGHKTVNAGTGVSAFYDHNNVGNVIEIDADANSSSAMYGLVMAIDNAGAGLEYAFRFNGSEIVASAIGGSQDKKIRVSISGTDYFIPLHTA